ncbi:uncharacterized protein LOC132279678 [Cornus florida]|uniref:uncharacterized protein LOC132279678 n=1 Tax=Cornus florida TaxID=4283 RepID=UPI00289BBFB0|nr:uncharacterized protein LOC132279678 [Cornus florida]
MSRTSSLLLCILCLSFYVCNARPLGAITKESQKQFHLPTKNIDEKVKPATVWNNEVGVAINGERMLLKESDEVHEDRHSKPKQARADKKELKDHKRVIVSSGSAKNESTLISVSWHVPHRKEKDQQPEINSDYPLPQPHPGIHN